MKTSSTLGLAEAVRLVVVHHRGARGVDALRVAVALRVGQVVDHVGEDRLGCLEAEGCGVADVELQDPVPLCLEALCLDQDRSADVVADPLQLLALADLAHGPILAGRRRRPSMGLCPGGQHRLTLDHLAHVREPCRSCLFWSTDPVSRARLGRRARRPTRAMPGCRGCCASGARRPGRADRRRGRRPRDLRAGRRSSRALAGIPTSPPSPDAVLLSTVYVDPTARHGGVGRLLVQGMARDLVQREITAVEAFGDTRGRSTGCVMPAEFLGRVGFKTQRAHVDHTADADGPADGRDVEERGRGGAGEAVGCRTPHARAGAEGDASRTALKCTNAPVMVDRGTDAAGLR